MNISQAFETQIIRVMEDGTEVPVLPSLAQAVTSWEREFSDEDEKQQDLEVDDEDEDESEPDEEEEEEEEEAVADEEGFLVADEDTFRPNGNLRVMAKVSAEMLADLKALEASTDEHKIRFVFSGILVREFDIGNDATLALNQGIQPQNHNISLEVDILFDVYGQDTRY